MTLTLKQIQQDVKMAERYTVANQRHDWDAYDRQSRQSHAAYILRARTALPEYAKALQEVMEDIEIALSGHCGCIKDWPGENYTCEAHRRLRERIASYHAQDKPNV